MKPGPVERLVRRGVQATRLRWPARTTVTVAALLLIGCQLLLRIWMTSGSWFMWDDYIFLADIARGDNDLAWLFQSHFSLFMPVSLLLTTTVDAAGFDWSAVAAQIIVLQLVANLACWWMLRTLFGDRTKMLLALAVFLFAPFTAPAALWWSVAINQLPFIIGFCGAVAAHVLHLRTGRIRWAIVATVFLLLALGSYVKAPLIVPVLLAITWLWFTDGTTRERVRGFVRRWPSLVLYSVPVAAYAGFWFTHQSGSLPPQRCELAGVMSLSVFQTVGTTVAGGPWAWRIWTGGIDPFVAKSSCVPLAYQGDPSLLVGGAPQSLLEPPLALVIAAWVLILLTILVLWGRYRGALAGLWIAVPYVAASAVFVFAGRAGTWGSEISAREMRYFADLAVVAAIVVGTATMPIVGATRAVRPRREPLLTVAPSRSMVVVLGVVVMTGWIGSTVAYALPWHDRWSAQAFPERAFVTTTMDDLAKLPPDDTVEIADVALPVVIANPVIAPYNLPSRKLAPLAPRLVAVTHGNDLLALDDSGHLRDADVDGPVRTQPGELQGCGHGVFPTGTIDIVPVVNRPWWLKVEYLAADAGDLRVHAGDTTTTVHIAKGLHTLFVRTEGAYDEVTLTSLDGIGVCVDSMSVGDIVATGGDS